MNQISVLIVDDSRLIQEVLSQAIRNAPGFRIVGIASNGKDAVAMARKLKPDIATLDIILPDTDGLDVLDKIRETGCRVVVLSDLARPESTVAIQALELGAVDCIAKPSGGKGTPQFGEMIVERLRHLAAVDSQKLDQLTKRVPASKPMRLARSCVVIGSSAGGPILLRSLVPLLPPDLKAAVIVVQHLPRAFSRQFATQLAAASEIRVRPALQGDALVEGTVLVAPGDEVLKVEWIGDSWGCVTFSSSSQTPHGVMPWIDAAMATAALLYGRRTIGVLLSGMGRDGVEGMRAIQKAGGPTMAQDEATSLIYGMPRAAREAGVADKILPIDKMAEAVTAAVRGLGEAR